MRATAALALLLVGSFAPMSVSADEAPATTNGLEIVAPRGDIRVGDPEFRIRVTTERSESVPDPVQAASVKIVLDGTQDLQDLAEPIDRDLLVIASGRVDRLALGRHRLTVTARSEAGEWLIQTLAFVVLRPRIEAAEFRDGKLKLSGAGLGREGAMVELPDASLQPATPTVDGLELVPSGPLPSGPIVVRYGDLASEPFAFERTYGEAASAAVAFDPAAGWVWVESMSETEWKLTAVDGGRVAAELRQAAPNRAIWGCFGGAGLAWVERATEGRLWRFRTDPAPEWLAVDTTLPWRVRSLAWLGNGWLLRPDGDGALYRLDPLRGGAPIRVSVDLPASDADAGLAVLERDGNPIAWALAGDRTILRVPLALDGSAPAPSEVWWRHARPLKSIVAAPGEGILAVERGGDRVLWIDPEHKAVWPLIQASSPITALAARGSLEVVFAEGGAVRGRGRPVLALRTAAGRPLEAVGEVLVGDDTDASGLVIEASLGAGNGGHNVRWSARELACARQEAETASRLPRLPGELWSPAADHSLAFGDGAARTELLDGTTAIRFNPSVSSLECFVISAEIEIPYFGISRAESAPIVMRRLGGPPAADHP